MATEPMMTDSVAWGRDALDCERRLLSCGLWSPVELFNASVDHQLSGDSFADAKHGEIFCTLLGWAEIEGDRQPTGIALKRLLPDVTSDDWRRFVYLECSAAGVESYARLVAHYAALRQEAVGCWQRLGEIVGDNLAAKADRILNRHWRERRVKVSVASGARPRGVVRASV